MPPSNNFISEKDLKSKEPVYPLTVQICDNCWLLQTEDFLKADELFRSDYAYFSSTSSSWLEHCSDFVTTICDRLNITKNNQVVEVACNDGYLLQYFLAKKIPCLGIEPCKDAAEIAQNKGIAVVKKFFNERLAKKLVNDGMTADLIVANNVIAHVPDVNNFVSALKILLKPSGTITAEFPHLLRLLENGSFDTIYHEHFSYFSLLSIEPVFERSGLKLFDAEKLSTHGGSLRIYICHQTKKQPPTARLIKYRQEESKNKLNSLETYANFQFDVDSITKNLLDFLINCRKLNLKVAAYGAAAKGNTLLNYAGINQELVTCVYDEAKSKQGKYLPGSKIPILSPSEIKKHKPDRMLILPWNLSDEIIHKHRYIFQWGAKFVTAVPQITEYS